MSVHSRTIPGHFGEFLQGRLGPDGPVVVVSAPSPDTGVTLTQDLSRAPGFDATLTACLPGRDLRRLCDLARLSDPVGRLFAQTTHAPGLGTGVSTSIRLAFLRLLGSHRLSPADEAEILLKCEGASDPLMHPRPETHLWASRAAQTLRRLPPVNGIEVVGGIIAPPCATDPEDSNFADISDLIDLWPDAVTSGDMHAIGALTTQSAFRNAQHRGGPDLSGLMQAANATNAAGILLAHTGGLAGLIYASGQTPPAALPAVQVAGLSDIRPIRIGSTS